MFVLTIFVGTLLTFLTYFIREKMYPGKQVELPVPTTTNDQFAILIEKTPGMKEAEVKKIQDLLTKTGAIEVIDSKVEYDDK